MSEYGEEARLPLPVFHGGSGSDPHDIHEALDYGVVKMNIDTDMQYAYTGAIAEHCLRNYDGVLKVDGEAAKRRITTPRYLPGARRDGDGGASEAGGRRS